MAEQKTSGGIGFLGLLTILFIGLKLTGHIQWEWLWVLSPLWIPLALVLAVGGFFLLVYLFFCALDRSEPKFRSRR